MYTLTLKIEANEETMKSIAHCYGWRDPSEKFNEFMEGREVVMGNESKTKITFLEVLKDGEIITK